MLSGSASLVLASEVTSARPLGRAWAPMSLATPSERL